MQRASLVWTLGMTCMALLLANPAAFAGFNYKKDEPESSLNASAALKNKRGHSVTQLGSGVPAEKQSLGDNMALSRAFKIITPQGWETIAEPYADKKVSWETEDGQTWIDALEQIGQQHNIKTVVDWKNNSVMVPVEGMAGGSETVQDEWVLKRGSFKKQLSRWAKIAGYEVVWNSKYDFWISADARFHGDFTDAVKEAVKALYRNGTRISADIYPGNDVIYISSAKEKE